jgi:subtilisin family serine protease
MALASALNSGIDVYSSVGNTSAQGVLFPASMTAENSPVPLKAMYPYAVVSVAAVDEADLKAPFSAWGSLVDVTAPGTNIYAALPNGNYGWWSGTSMATAVASGVGSLAVSIEGRRGQATGVVETAVDIDSLNPGYSGMLGFGRLKAYKTSRRR